MTTHRYPTVAQISTVLKWNNEGVAALDPGMRHDGERMRSHARNLHRRDLRQIIPRLGLGHDTGLWKMVYRSHRKPIDTLPAELLTELLRNLRVHGYIYPVPKSGDMAAVPLTGKQLHLIRAVSWGSTMDQFARDMGITVKSQREVMQRAREELSCHTTAQVIACVHRNDWLPGHDEHNRLLYGRLADGRVAPLLGCGYQTVAS